MNARSRRTIEIATLLGNRGFDCVAIEVHTSDGRTWTVAPVIGGWRLFEMHIGTDRQPTEHDCPDGCWGKSDLIDYLETVTARAAIARAEGGGK